VEIDGVRAELAWCEGRPIVLINAWEIATGSGWIEKAEDWAKEHRALLYDTEAGFDEPIRAACAHNCGVVVVRQFNVRD
jgi:hypothetical protein